MNKTRLRSEDFKITKNGVYINSHKATPGLLLIHADWCGHCQRFKPTFIELSQELGSTFRCLSIEDSDMDDDLKRSLNFSGYPSIKFFDQSGKIIADYNGNDRMKTTILKHICDVYHHCIKYH